VRDEDHVYSWAIEPAAALRRSARAKVEPPEPGAHRAA
jgi:hypothetical protein